MHGRLDMGHARALVGVENAQAVEGEVCAFHRARLIVRSTLGSGSEFTVRF